MRFNLPLELDFANELLNAEACRANLASPRSRLRAGRVHVPRCLPELTSHRVLTMEFIGDAVGVADVEGMRRMGIRWGGWVGGPGRVGVASQAHFLLPPNDPLRLDEQSQLISLGARVRQQELG